MAITSALVPPVGLGQGPACRLPCLTPAPDPGDVHPVPVAATRYRAAVWTDPVTGVTHSDFPPAVEAGKPVLLGYSRRLQDLGVEGELQEVVARVRIDGGDWQRVPFDMQARDDHRFKIGPVAQLMIPDWARDELQVAFELVARDGRRIWDNNGGPGLDYRTTILPQGGALIRFDADWTQTVVGDLRQGETVRVAYDVGRLLRFLTGTSANGLPTYGASLFVSFDDAPPQEYRFGRDFETVDMPSFRVPHGASTLSLWFVGSARGGHTFYDIHVGGFAYDSNWGQNYRFPVQPACSS
jgi:hypothetical protein